MYVESIKNGIVIDHITAGRAMYLYRLLGLEERECIVAIIKNVPSGRMGKKDIIKIDSDIDINMDILGYVDPSVTVNIIRDGAIVEKRSISLPSMLVNVLFCKNPRCITSTEQELDHIFKLSDTERRIYRCAYCEAKFEERAQRADSEL